MPRHGNDVETFTWRSLCDAMSRDADFMRHNLVQHCDTVLLCDPTYLAWPIDVRRHHVTGRRMTLMLREPMWCRMKLWRIASQEPQRQATPTSHRMYKRYAFRAPLRHTIEGSSCSFFPALPNHRVAPEHRMVLHVIGVCHIGWPTLLDAIFTAVCRNNLDTRPQRLVFPTFRHRPPALCFVARRGAQLWNITGPMYTPNVA